MQLDNHNKKIKSKVNQDDVKLLINRDISEMESKIDKKLNEILASIKIMHDALVHKGIIIPKYVSD